MGTAVLSTYHSGIPELITHGEHGLLAKEKDAQGLADNIEMLVRDKSLRQRLKMNARKQIEAMSDVDKLNRQLIELLSGVVEGRGK